MLNFTTLQDSRFSSACTHHMTCTLDPTAPDAPPTNVVAVAVDTSSIHLSWAAPPPDTWNGVITHYIISYYSLTNLSSSVNRTTNETEALLDDLDPDTTYQFTVAAETVSLGPSSAPVVQRTYPLPPPLDSVPLTLPMIPMVSMTTIPVLLPPVNSSLFRYTHYHRCVVGVIATHHCSHFWVIVVKLSDPEAPFLMEAPTQMFPDNSSFGSYSTGFSRTTTFVCLSFSVLTHSLVHYINTELAEDTPYIASEISSSGYSVLSSRVFVVGDENKTRNVNDFPELYRNGPLLQLTNYSVFVWGFLPAIPPSSVSVCN